MLNDNYKNEKEKKLLLVWNKFILQSFGLEKVSFLYMGSEHLNSFQLNNFYIISNSIS